MAAYPKIWTTIMYEDWFVAMSCLERGVMLQMFLLAKIQGDTGTIWCRNWTHLAHDLGLNRKTLSRTVSVFTRDKRIFTQETDNGCISITIPKYREYQDLSTGRQVTDKKLGRGKNPLLEKNRIEKKRSETNSVSAPPDVCVEVVGDLNAKAGTAFKPESKATQKLIAARIAEGHTVDEFRKVHTNKARDWLNDPKMVKFLRPETLYRASHFESYLNERDTGRMFQSQQTRNNLTAIASWSPPDDDDRRAEISDGNSEVGFDLPETA